MRSYDRICFLLCIFFFFATAWLAVVAYLTGNRIAFAFAAIAVLSLSVAMLVKQSGWAGLAGAVLSAGFLAAGGSAFFWLPALFPDVAREVAGFYGVAFGAVGCFTGLPKLLARHVASRRPRRAPEAGEGCRFGMLERYIPLCTVMVSPPYALCKQPGGAAVFRAALCVLLFLGGAGFVFGAFGTWEGYVFAGVFCLLFSLAVLPDGLLHGVIFASQLTAVAAGGYYGGRLALFSYAELPVLSVLLLVLLVALLIMAFSFLYVRFDRRFSSGAAMREAGAYVVGVPLPRRPEAGFTIRGDAPPVLRRATVTFETRGERDAVYYFSAKWADLCRFCRRHGFVPVGFRALHDEPEITYYAYTPATERANRAWQRCFRNIRRTEITFAEREDAAHTAFFALLPSLREAVTAYHMLFFSGAETSGESYPVRYTLLFREEEQATDFLSSIRQSDYLAARQEEDPDMQDARFCHRVALVERAVISEGEMNRRAEAMIALAEAHGGEYFGWDVMPEFDQPGRDAGEQDRAEETISQEKQPEGEETSGDEKEN